MRNLKGYLAIILLTTLSVDAMAWGMSGHRIVASLAQDMLSCKANKKINKVLGGNTPTMVANWGDFIKSDPKINHFDDWHYTNLDSNLTRSQFDSAIMATTSGQCVYQILSLTEELKKNPKDAQKLKLLIHIVGDMCQPMHMGRESDRGGNDIRITWFGRKMNLHSLWDTHIIGYNELSYTEYAEDIKRMFPRKKQKFSKELVVETAWQTYQITEKLYKTSEKTSDGYRYIYDYQKTCEERLSTGGMLLATILDYIY